MARPFWKGSISFGLVEIPVSLQPAVKTHELSFSLLDRKDFSPVGNKRYNKNTGRDVPWDEVVRGYEYEPEEYVVLSDEELRRANVEANETIEILEFVERSEIDPVFYEAPYYVEPLKKASKSYANGAFRIAFSLRSSSGQPRDTTSRTPRCAMQQER